MAVGFVLLAGNVVGIDIVGTVEAAVARGGPTDIASLIDYGVDFVSLAFTDTGFGFHLDTRGSVEVDDNVIAEGLSSFVGGGETQSDGLVG